MVAATSSGRPRRKFTILLVEDHEDTLDAFARLLSSEGYTVLPSSSVATALELASRADVDVLVADAVLPDGSGWTLFGLLRERHPHLVGVAVTAHGFPEHIARSTAARFCAHLTKPVNADELRNAIEFCMATRSAA